MSLPPKGQGLFRQQAMQRQTERLHGDILLLPRFSHSLILGLLLAWVVLAFFWLISSTYARKETVSGWLDPAAGVVRVVAEGSGIIKQILVSEGDQVTEGQPLMIINGDRMLADGESLEVRLLEEYETQRLLLTAQLTRNQRGNQMRKRDIAQRIVASEENLRVLDKQVKTLEERNALVSVRVKRYANLKREGHVSLVAYDAVKEEELLLRSEMQALSRSRINQQNTIQQLQTEQQLLPDEYSNAKDQMQARLSDIAQKIAQLHGQRARTIKASRPGIVNNLQIREGQQTQNGLSLLSLVPVDAKLTAHLLIPVRAIGFVKNGQTIDIRYDAFPYQKFGLYSAEVVSVSDSILLPDELIGAPIQLREPVYRVFAHLEKTTVQAYGKNHPLKPGMTLSADIRLGDRSLIQWLLEPIYSLKGRL